MERVKVVWSIHTQDGDKEYTQSGTSLGVYDSVTRVLKFEHSKSNSDWVLKGLGLTTSFEKDGKLVVLRATPVGSFEYALGKSFMRCQKLLWGY